MIRLSPRWWDSVMRAAWSGPYRLWMWVDTIVGAAIVIVLAANRVTLWIIVPIVLLDLTIAYVLGLMSKRKSRLNEAN